MPDVERTTVPIEDLTPAEYNPRSISEEALRGLAASIERWGLVQEVVCNRLDDGTLRIVGGHQRLQVLRDQGVDQVPVAIVELSEDEERALNVSLNNPEIAGDFTVDLQGILDGLELPDLGDLRFDDLLEEVGDIFQAGTTGFPDLPTGDRAPIQQMTFTVHDDQAEVIREALARAKSAGPFVDIGNENGNGNALARVCEAYRG